MKNVSATNFKMRKDERRPFTQHIDYSVIMSDSKEPKWLDLKGTGVDISEAGIGIQTDYPLEPGQVVWFDSGVEAKAGFVKWSTRVDDGYRAGIELDGKQVKTLDSATETFNKQLDAIERRCSEPGETPESLLKATKSAIDNICEACKNFELLVNDKNIVRDAQIRFRLQTNPILSKSYCINRVRTWPQGYQGDYKTIETIYRNSPLSEGIGHYIDRCCLDFPLGIGVRNRIKKLEDILRDELLERQAPSVLNIACGSCREVFELASEIQKSGARFTCIDLDNDALAFAANRLSYTNISPMTSDQVVLRKYNAVRMFDHDMNMSEFGMQDIIYSVGLFDYLPSDFLVNLLRALYDMTNPGGKLIASFKDADKYRSQEYHWLFDWDGFLQRNKEDFRNILSDAKIPESAITETCEDSGIIVFYVITK